MIVDSQGRRFRNLRVSLTSACNYACTYCVPNGKRLVAAQDELTEAQILRAIELLIATAGIDKLRITGGEPLVSPKFDGVLRAVMRMPLDDVSFTTNGQLLERKADVLRASGISRVNVSLDTLDPIAFRRIARGGDLDTVLRGIDLVQSLGCRVKINMVPMRSSNLDQLLPLLEYCLARDIEIRFIELMNMGHLRYSNEYRRELVTQEQILATIAERYEFSRIDAPYDSTAVRYEIAGRSSEPLGRFGIIANESEPFCSACTRLRLSSNGYLYGCLSNAKRHYVGDLLDAPEDEAKRLLADRLSLALGDKQQLAFRGEVTVMKFIGG
jgi:cyclic pyranopterin phosphate synthase